MGTKLLLGPDPVIVLRQLADDAVHSSAALLVYGELVEWSEYVRREPMIEVHERALTIRVGQQLIAQ